jgi:hypothetical protein
MKHAAMAGARRAVWVSSLAAVACLALAASIGPGLRRFHLGGPDRHLNDQVAYVSVARTFAETGRLESRIVYPAMLARGHTTGVLYMPGQYLALGLVFRLLGFSPLASAQPAAAAYLIAVAAAAVAATRLAGPVAGIVAGLLVAVFPPHLLYALSAMAEMPLVAATALAVAGVVLAPGRGGRVLAAALLTALATTFRETGALLCVPLAILALRDGRRAAAEVLGASLAGALVAMACAPQRPDLLTPNLFDGRFSTVYTDGVTAGSLRPPAGAYPAAALQRFLANVFMIARAARAGIWTADLVLFEIVVLLGVAALAHGLVRRDRAALAAGSLALLATGVNLGLYAFYQYRGLRTVLLATPALAVWLGALAAAAWARGRRLRGAVVLGLGLSVALAVWCGLRLQATAASLDAQDDADLAFMSTLGHDDRTLLVAPFDVALVYVLGHHPVRFAFVPANAPSLDVLARHERIGTLVARPAEAEAIGADALAAAGLAPAGQWLHRGIALVVYRQGPRPGRPDAGP